MPNLLRTATPNGDWRSFKFTCEETAGLLGAKAAWAAGTPWYYQVQDSVGALIEDVDFGEEGVLIYHAEKIIAAKNIGSGESFLPGQTVYWDPLTRFVSALAETGNLRIGIATEPAGETDEIVEIDLDGADATSKAVV